MDRGYDIFFIYMATSLLAAFLGAILPYRSRARRTIVILSIWAGAYLLYVWYLGGQRAACLVMFFFGTSALLAGFVAAQLLKRGAPRDGETV